MSAVVVAPDEVAPDEVGPDEPDGMVDRAEALDLVNVALLGTDRRSPTAPAGEDPAVWVLTEAARRRAVRVVGESARAVVVPEAGPEPAASVLGPPPLAARAALDELLTVQGAGPALTAWLDKAVTAGYGLAPEHWTPVLDRARRAAGIDRQLLGVALGEPGLWFARHNPAWAVVVRTIEEGRA